MSSTTDPVVYNDVELTKKAQQTLRALQDIGGEGTTGEIQAHTPFPNRQSVHHQMDARLTVAGLVERAGKRENPGATFDANVWRITKDGWAFLRENRERLATNLNLELLTGRFERLAKRLQTIFGRVHDVERGHRDLEAQYEEHARRTDTQYRHLQRTKLDVDDDSYRRLQQTVRHLTNRVEELEEELARVDGEIEDVEGGVNGVHLEVLEKADESRTARADLGERVHRVEDALEERGGWFARFRS
ncbi:hypothetical protein [Halarchaeum nitratireducens]|uniref:Uncharacterized protein n=1 Tax=Halarchaeum nitratireducens TaxID=489913 RepID=A0A830GF76_9EURY|nr:hypothetical protein [Halarchaeum nitratireducens]GGN26314.1 hypothetical protein GCM10009021_30720 [Halarchaeum nitratireducens]